MANPEHLAKIEESIEAWNTWRCDNPEITPALWGADLEGLISEGLISKEPTLRGLISGVSDTCWQNSYAKPKHFIEPN